MVMNLQIAYQLIVALVLLTSISIRAEETNSIDQTATISSDTPRRNVQCVFVRPQGASPVPATCIAVHEQTGRVLSFCKGVSRCVLGTPGLPIINGIRIWSPDSTRQSPVYPIGLPAQVVFPLLPRLATNRKGPWLTDVTSSSVVIRWETDVPARSVIHIATPPGPAVRSVPRWVGGSAKCDDSGKNCVHSVRVTGLATNSRYSFLIGDVKPALRPAPGLSIGQHPAGSIVTAPTAGDFSFSVLGDVQAQTSYHWTVWKDVSAFSAALQINMGRNGGPVFHTGDMTQTFGESEAETRKRWSEFFANGSLLLKDNPFYPAIGNNDDSSSFKKYFGTEGPAAPATYYSVDYGRTHFVVLAEPGEPGLGSCGSSPSSQVQWLRNDLANASARLDIDNIIVIAHHGPRGYGGYYGHNMELLACLESMFMDDSGPTDFFKKLRLVLSGHHHYYQRIEHEHIVSGLRRKVQYVTVGTAGAVHRCPDNSPEVKMMSPICPDADGTNDYQSVVVRVRGPMIELRTYNFAYDKVTGQKVSRGPRNKWYSMIDCVAFDANGDEIQDQATCQE
jgi:hypothetical protein